MRAITGGLTMACLAIAATTFAQARAVPARGIPAVALGGPEELTLQQAVDRALENNVDLRLGRDELAAADLRLWGARGSYDPLVGFSAGRSSNATPTSSALQGSDITAETNTSRTFGPTISQYLPTGGSVSASFANARLSTNSVFSTVNPVYTSNLSLDFQQPLLRGLAIDDARRQVQTSKLQTGITDADFTRAATAVVRSVQEQYWLLVYTEQAYNTQVESRNLAANQRTIIAQQVQAGLTTPVALTSAEAEVAIREQQVLQAEVLIVAAQNGLKRLLAKDSADAIWSRRIVAVDRPALQEPPPPLEDVMRQAFDHRPELKALALQAQELEVNRSYASWQSKPLVTLNGSFSSIGQAGQVYQPVYDPGSGGITPIGRVLDPGHAGFGGWQQAWNQVFAHNYPSWNVRLDVQVPLFNRTARAQVAQVDVSRRQLEARVDAQQQAIMVDVSNAYEALQLQRKVLEVTRVARELSQEQLRGETARFEAGFTTNFEVLRYQRDLSEAQVRELRAMIDYQLAVAALQTATGTIVDDAALRKAR